ncbi:hypothetical protein ACFS6H_11745 [Terrimonas rubra]|uniref:Uncharacterized protein n=1 Tax=Terrimonas rubra TaxID=1035890 RepID=A0ABW6A4Y3_9BACT
MLTRLFLTCLVTLFSLSTFSAHRTQGNLINSTENKAGNAGKLSLYTRIVPSAECGSTENIFIYLENSSVELAPGVPVWGGNPSNPQPVAWAMVFSNWGSNSGTAYLILNGYVHSSFIPC